MFETSSSSRVNTFYSRAKEGHVLFTRENKALFLFLSVVHEIKESLDDDEETTFRSSV